jgi:hypothetical protein
MAKQRNRPATNLTPAPELLRDEEAGAYISMSAAYLRADRCRGHVGGSTPGPAFLRMGRTIRYRREDLDAWLAERRVDRGVRTRDLAPQPAA